MPDDFLPTTELGPEPVRVGGQAASPPALAPNGLPLLESHPTAPVAIYLDFDGFTGLGYGGQENHAPYSIDADGGTFNAQEQGNIVAGWQQVAAHFAPFDVNVTTIFPSVPKTWTVITPSHTGNGLSWREFNGYAPSSFIRQDHFLSRTTIVLHEIGHDFNLSHQSEYDQFGNRTAEYRTGYDSLHAAIMGMDYVGSVPKWYIGQTASAKTFQDDIALIAAKIQQYQPPGGDGFRADDHGNTISAATPLAAAEGVQASYGIVERLTDVDVFSFQSEGGLVSIAATRDAMSGVDIKLDIYAADGTLFAASDTIPNDQTLSLNLPAGTYFAAVSSHGDYSDIGPYNLFVESMPPNWHRQDVGAPFVAGYSQFDSTTQTFLVGGGGTRIGQTADSFQFMYQRLSGDGEIIARVAAVENTNAMAMAGVMIRQSLEANSPHSMMLATPTSGNWLRSRTTSGGGSIDSPRANEAFTPIWVKLVRSGNILTGYSSADGVNWTLEGAATIGNLPSQVFIGLATTATNNSTLNDAVFSNVTVTGNTGIPTEAVNALPPPANLTIVSTSSTSVDLAWNAVEGATGYTIEQSADGASYVAVGTIDANATTFSSSGLASHQRFFYRVRANDATGVSAASAVASGLTRPSGVTNLTIASLSETELALTWRETSGEVGYRIERSHDGGAFHAVATLDANVPVYSESGLAPGGIYTYRVVSLDALGDASSAEATFSTRLPAPAIAVSEATSTQVSLSWLDLLNESVYILERSTDGVSFLTLATLAPGTSAYTDHDVAPLAAYHYRIRAVNGPIPGTLSEVVAAATQGGSVELPWNVALIGMPATHAATSFDDDTLTMVSGGTGFAGTSDSALFVYRELVGDGSLIVRVTSLTGTDPLAAAGLMVRESLAPDARFLAAGATVGGEYRSRRRTAPGAAVREGSNHDTYGPLWLKIVRAGIFVHSYSSSDAQTWRSISSIQNVPMSEHVLIGMTLASANASRLSVATFDEVLFNHNAPIAFDDGYTMLEDQSVVIPPSTQTAISAGSTWKYFDLGGPGSGWQSPAFNDSSWASGAAPLGYGDPGMFTTLAATDANGNPVTDVYLRHEFFVTEVHTFSSVLWRYQADDAVSVYLNGTLKFQSAGLFDLSEPLESRWFETNGSGSLVSGRNVVAVRLRQATSANLPDLRFDMSLTLIRPALGVSLNDRNLTKGHEAVLVESPEHGVVELRSDGTFAYTPDPNFNGVDEFRYYIHDGEQRIFPEETFWKYLDGGADPGAGWQQVEYEDSSWLTGMARLGFGGGEYTEVNAGPSGERYPTTFFRREIHLPEGVEADSLRVHMRQNDGGAIYINGVEVYRDETLAPNARYSDYALDRHPNAHTGTAVVDLPASFVLRPGKNVIAVEEHNYGPHDNGMEFDLEIYGRYRSAPATATFTIQAVPDVPAAADDVYRFLGDIQSAAPRSVLVNDEDGDGDPIVAVLQSPTSFGVLTLADDGSFVYTPGPGFLGHDSFTYAVSDGTPGKGLSNVATVTIYVVPTLGVDFNGDARVTETDLDMLMSALAAGSNESLYDVSGDGQVSRADLDYLVAYLVETTTGIGTRYGDIDLDGDVDTGDVALLVRQFGRQEAFTWQSGDWDISGATGLTDLLLLQKNLGVAAAPSAEANSVIASVPAKRTPSTRNDIAAPDDAPPPRKSISALDRKPRRPHLVDMAAVDSIAFDGELEAKYRRSTVGQRGRSVR